MENTLIEQIKKISEFVNNIKQTDNLEIFFEQKNNLNDMFQTLNKEITNYKKEINLSIYNKRQEFKKEINQKKTILLKEIQDMVNTFHNEDLLETEPYYAFNIFDDFLITYTDISMLPIHSSYNHDYTYRYALCLGSNDKIVFPLKHHENGKTYAVMKEEHALNIYNKFSEYLFFCRNY